MFLGGDFLYLFFLDTSSQERFEDTRPAATPTGSGPRAETGTGTGATTRPRASRSLERGRPHTPAHSLSLRFISTSQQLFTWRLQALACAAALGPPGTSTPQLNQNCGFLGWAFFDFPWARRTCLGQDIYVLTRTNMSWTRRPMSWSGHVFPGPRCCHTAGPSLAD